MRKRVAVVVPVTSVEVGSSKFQNNVSSMFLYFVVKHVIKKLEGQH